MKKYRTKKYRNGIKITTGKKGPRVNVGMPGFNVSYGLTGIYLNTNNPLTGKNTRTRLDKSPVKKKEKNKLPENIDMHMDTEGSIFFTDDKGNKIKNEAIINKIKRLPHYSSEVANLRDQIREDNFKKLKESEEENYNLINIGKFSPNVLDEKGFWRLKENILLESYEPREYNEIFPVIDDAKAILEEESKSAFSSYSKKKYISDNLESRYKLEVDKWHSAREDFDKKEMDLKIKKDSEFKEKYYKTMELADKLVSGDTKSINKTAEYMVSSLELHFATGIVYSYDSNNSTFFVDLDLPRLTEIPLDKTTQRANGLLKIKSKTKKQLKDEYIQLVFGLAQYITANFLNISPVIDCVVVSGKSYIDRSEEVEKVDYIYSIKYPREKMLQIDFSKIDPYEFSLQLESVSKVLKSGVLRPIKPFNKILLKDGD